MGKIKTDNLLDAANDTCFSPDHLLALRIWRGLDFLLSAHPAAHTQMNSWKNLPAETPVDYLTPLYNHQDTQPLLFHILNIDPVDLAFRGEAYTLLMRETHATLLAKALLYLSQPEQTPFEDNVKKLLEQSVNHILAQATQVGRDMVQHTVAHEVQNIATMTDNTAYRLARRELVVLYQSTWKILTSTPNIRQSVGAIGLLASIKPSLFDLS